MNAIESADDGWPQAALSPIARLRALAAGLPSAVLVERTVSHDLDAVWGYFSDMEHSLPTFDQAVASFTVSERTGTRLVARARSPRLRIPVTFDVDLEPGWCWMTARSRIYAVGFAAERDGQETRFAHLEAYTPPGPAWVRATLHRILRSRLRALDHHVRADIDALERAVGTARTEV
ncbi:MAG: hypothetical protein ABIR68_15160 [Ilumatobacteraceae bacterium]